MTSAVAVAGAQHGKFGLAPITAAQADTTSLPKLSEQKWWPSKWGADDQAGASNHMTPAKVLDAIKWIKDGKVHKLGHNYDSAMPCSASGSSPCASPAVRPAAHSATTG